jgi:flagellar motility protein MotE (MotC chaperone)/sporulation protein YlmC with PRC-barrel domain
MGTPIADADGKTFGHVKEFAVAPLDDSSRVKGLVVKRSNAARGATLSLISIADLTRDDSGNLRLVKGADPKAMTPADDYLLLERDLLDQQIIDIHGHKVVRVNDVDMVWETIVLTGQNGNHGDGQHDNVKDNLELTLRIAEVEVGTRGAVRRLLKGLPVVAVERISCRARATIIPWDFVDLIDRDPARRVRLKIEQDRLAKMHPSDLADILEELAPAEREALFSSLDEEVAAEALEEVDVKTQKTLIDSLDTERVAGIIEEMDPGAAADLLSELTDERSDAILEEMDEKERHDVEELLEHPPESAAGMMTSEFAAAPADGTVEDAFAALTAFEGDLASVSDIQLVDAEQHLHGTVALSTLMLAPRDTPLARLHDGHIVSATFETHGRKVAELFDKYNLRCLPVLDSEKRLAGVVHAENVIAWLRTS